MESIIKPQDEELHPIGKEEHWQESWYFNWADVRHNAFGLTRIGFRFNQRQIDGLVLTIRNGRPEYLYPAVNISHKGGWSDQKAAEGLRARKLLYRIEEPLKKWRLQLEGRAAMDLAWTAFTPAFNFHGSGAGELTPNVAGRHFEQSGRVTGWTRFKGQELEINGVGQRDKSWGVRDWANIEGWNWISAQFGEELAFNAWDGVFKGRRYINGFIFINGTNYPVDNLIIQYNWGHREHVPERAQLIIHASGKKLEVTAKALGQFPLVKKGLWIQETHAQFTASLNGKEFSGIGVIEHAWHADKLKILRQFPELFKAGARAMRRR